MALMPYCSTQYCHECKKDTRHSQNSIICGGLPVCDECPGRKLNIERRKEKKKWDKLTVEQKLDLLYDRFLKPQHPQPEHDCNPVY